MAYQVLHLLSCGGYIPAVGVPHANEYPTLGTPPGLAGGPPVDRQMDGQTRVKT